MTKTGPLIALMDDTPEDREAARRHLSQYRGPDGARYRFVEYEGTEDILQACSAEPPDCLLLDYALQSTDGLEVLERLTGGTGVAPFAVILLTGRGSESVAVRALKRGALDYVVKGHTTGDSLRQAVADAVAKFAARPAVERKRAERERSHRAMNDAGSSRERLILIVDDSPEDRLAARRALSRASQRSYRYLEEATAAEGLALCRSAGLDCLLLDYSLPDADGLEFLAELTGGSGITPFPVIMMTGRGDEAIAVQALKLGASDYLVKGRFTAEALEATVEQAVRRVAARRLQEEQRMSVLERLEVESRRRADQLAEADRRKDEFLAMLAHELRNPLAPMANALRVMRLAGPASAQGRSALDIAERQLAHLARLVSDLMEVSRITHGRIGLEPKRIELGEVLGRALQACRPLFEGRSQQLSVRQAARPVWLHADATRLEQIFTNLLNNAAKYTDFGGRVDVRVDIESGIDSSAGADADAPVHSQGLHAHPAPGHVRIRVSDNGIGIDQATLPKVFDLFAQADRSLDRALGGLGIGLTLVRALAEQHGGTVSAHSDGPGKGSAFTVRLPVSGDADAQAAPAKPAPAASRSNCLKVLLAHDDAERTELLVMLLEAWGHEIHVVQDGVAAVQAIGAVRPDVAFVDVGLARMDGYEVARTVRATFGEAWPVLAAVDASGYGSDRQRAEQAGFRHHLVKPVHPDDLLRVLGDCTSQRGSLPGGCGDVAAK